MEAHAKVKPEWEEYIGRHICVCSRDLKATPFILDDDADQDFLLKTRFRWFLDTTHHMPERLFNIWKSPEDAFLEERLGYEGSLRDFQRESKSFPLLMAQDEVTSMGYLRDLYWCLKVLPVRTGMPALVIGPTFGGEVDVVKHAGASPHLIGDTKSSWLSMAEERLLHTKTVFDSPFRGSGSSKNPLVIILSKWSYNSVMVLRAAYDTLGDFGFLIFPSVTISMIVEAEQLGLRRRFLRHPNIAVFYKDITLPLKAGEDKHVH